MKIDKRLAFNNWIASLLSPNPEVGQLTNRHLCFDQAKAWCQRSEWERALALFCFIFGIMFARGEEEYKQVLFTEEGPVCLIRKICYGDLYEILNRGYTMAPTEENVKAFAADLAEFKRLFQEGDIDADKKGGTLLIPYYDRLGDVKMACKDWLAAYEIKVLWSQKDRDAATRAGQVIKEVGPVAIAISLEEVKEGVATIIRNGEEHDIYRVCDDWHELAVQSFHQVEALAANLVSRLPDNGWILSKLEELESRYQAIPAFRAMVETAVFYNKQFVSMVNAEQTLLAKYRENEKNPEELKKKEKRVRRDFRERFAGVSNELRRNYDSLANNIRQDMGFLARHKTSIRSVEWRVEANIFASFCKEVCKDGSVSWKPIDEGSNFFCMIMEDEFARYNFDITAEEKVQDMPEYSRAELDYCTFEDGVEVNFVNGSAVDGETGSCAFLDDEELVLNGKYTIKVENGIAYATRDIKLDVAEDKFPRGTANSRILVTSYDEMTARLVPALLSKLEIGTAIQLVTGKDEAGIYHHDIVIDGRNYGTFRQPYAEDKDVRKALLQAFALESRSVSQVLIVDDFVKTKSEESGLQSVVIFGHYGFKKSV